MPIAIKHAKHWKIKATQKSYIYLHAVRDDQGIWKVLENEKCQMTTNTRDSELKREGERERESEQKGTLLG